MIPKRVTLENFLSFGHKTSIHFADDEPLWVLGGPNGVGKSAVFDAMTFCLFGRHRGNGNEVDPLVRHGENGFQVSFEFAFDGVDYRVARGRSGKRSTQSVEAKPAGGEWARVPNVNAVADVAAWSKATLGLPYEAFTASVLLRQGEADAIVNAKGTERLQILKTVIGLGRYEDLSDRVHAAARKHAAEKDRLALLRATTPAVTPEELAAASAAAGVAADKKAIAAEAEKAAANLVGVAKQWAELDRRRRDLQAKLADAETRHANAAEIRSAHARFAELESVLPTLAKLVPLRAAVADAEPRLAADRAAHAAADARRAAAAARAAATAADIATFRDAEARHAADANRLADVIARRSKFLVQADEAGGLAANLSTFPADLDEQTAHAAAALAAAAAADRAAADERVRAETAWKQLDGERRAFGSVEAGVTCSRCHQVVDAEHAALERDRIETALRDAAAARAAADTAAAAAVAGLREAKSRADALGRERGNRDRVRDRLDGLRKTLESLGETPDAGRLRQEIAAAEAEAGGHARDRDAAAAKLSSAKRELAAAETETVAATADATRLGAAVHALDAKLAAASAGAAAHAESLPNGWRAATAADLHAYQAEYESLRIDGVPDRFRRLAEDAALRGEWLDQLRSAEASIEAVPPAARVPAAEAEALARSAAAAATRAAAEWQAARDAAANLDRRAADFQTLLAQMHAAETAAARHKTLDELLGKTGLQRDLVRTAEAKIVALADDTVRKLSDGDLSIELDTPEDGDNAALALRVRRGDDPTPIPVMYLSGSQKFRVAISVALAIGRFASAGAKPLECVIIDEGFGSLDRDGLRATADELNRLKPFLRRIILVSHQDEFTDHFPVVIRLAKGENGTTATPVRR